MRLKVTTVLFTSLGESTMESFTEAMVFCQVRPKALLMALPSSSTGGVDAPRHPEPAVEAVAVRQPVIDAREILVVVGLDRLAVVEL